MYSSRTNLEPVFNFSSSLIHRYETTNGIKVRQTSYMLGNNRVVTGYYSYIGPDGKLYTTHYTSDQNGYRATGSHLPVQDSNAQPVPVIYNEPINGPIPNQFVSSTPLPFVSSTPPFGQNPAYSPTTLSPIVVSSSTPFQSYAPTPQSYAPPPQSYAPPPQSYVPPSKRLPFPVYRQPPQTGYVYDNPRINSPYSVVSQQTPAPIPFPTYSPAPSNINSRVTTTLAPPNSFNDFNSAQSSTVSPLQDNGPVQFRPYIPPPPPIVTSTPRPFNNFSPNQPDTVLITPKPIYQQPQLPNSLSVNQNLLPPYLSVGPLNSSPQTGPQNFFPTALSDTYQPSPPTVAPLTITNLNFRKKRDDEK